MLASVCQGYALPSLWIGRDKNYGTSHFRLYAYDDISMQNLEEVSHF